ncbi:MAG: beta-hydroxyacyl-ACP dehydratase [Sedimentisphaerales bacterium]|nr:beta-hydroxyacyl-ACP dehydratase [Sedimentisphaerales bacterium]
MRFILLDKVTELVPGEKISSVKNLSLAEEYLADHFPGFPVLPGVLILEAMVETSAMLVRVTNNFAQSMIVLSEARNVKYKSFVKPGYTMQVAMEAKSISQTSSSFTGTAFVDDQEIVSARIKLRHYNLSDGDQSMSAIDNRIIVEMKNRAQLVGAC